MIDCTEVRLSLGAHALGALDPEESAEIETHLADCPACRAEADALAGLPALLGRVSEADIAQVASPPRAVLDRMLRTAARRRRRHRALFALAASVVVAAVGGTALAGLTGRGAELDTAAPVTAAQEEAAGAADSMAKALSEPIPDEPISDEPTPAAASSAGPAAAAEKTGPVELTGRRDGVHATLRLSTRTPEPAETARAARTTVEIGVTGVPEGRVVAVAADGARETVAEWTGEQVSFAGSTTFPIDRITRFEVRSAAGRVLLTIPNR